MTRDAALLAETVREAGALALSLFRTELKTWTKGASSPVSEADIAVNDLIERRLRSATPDYGWLSEESADNTARLARSLTWIVDPIDGTRAFIRGVPLYSVLIAVEIEDDIAVGVVYFPALDEMYSAGRGLGARWNGRPMRVSSVDSLSGSALVATDERIIAQDPHLYERYEHLRSSVDICRTWGDAYGHMLVASGRAEMMVDPFMKFWDYAPLKAIVEEAGGAFTDLAGVPTIYSGSAISTNGILHPEVLTRLAPATAEA